MPSFRPLARPATLAAAAFSLGALAAAAPLGAQQEKTRPKPPVPSPTREAGPGDTLTLVMPQLLKARSIGPAVMGGRVASIALDPQDPATFYVGLATGGIMKTTDNGATFSGIFEKEKVAAVGAIAIAPSDPKVVWVGTGKANDRNSTSWGNGVYRSEDGGATWQHVGLDKTKEIGRVVVHPTDPKTAWVAAMGDLWSPNAERGLYKTTDAGKTWKLVLAAPAPYGDRVGAGDVVVDPSDPNTLYAALYARRRLPWEFRYGPSATDGKDMGGIFKSTDGGATWKKLAGGLPSQTGRIGLDVYAKNPKIVYAIVQSDEGGQQSIDDPHSKKGGVFRSDDGGATWTRTSPLNPRPFYFSQIRVNPTDDKHVYVLGYMLHVSEDGGKTFREDRFKNVHSDNHALVIDPRSPKRLLLGTDGGAYQSYDEGAGWAHLSRIAAGEFYRVAVDSSAPFRICGGLQDNTNWVGPSQTRSKEGIRNADWTTIGGGDGSYCVFDASDPNVVYAESQQGYVFRFNLASGASKDLRPNPTEGSPAFRFHWTSPIVASRHTKGLLYYAGDRVFKLTDQGESWQVISPDLSSHEYDKMRATGSGAEDFGVAYALAESPVKAGLLWVGTDDGRLWKTENDGGSWQELSKNVPPPARGGWVSRIEASAHDPLVAYLAVDAHRAGDYRPHLLRTADGGRPWQSVAGDLPGDGPVKVVREDPVNPRMLWAGTEFGLYLTLDRGRHWMKFGGLPTVAVDDILLHPRDRDLVVATHGRSLYVLDDVRPLEEFTPQLAAKDAHLFAPRAATAYVPNDGWVTSAGSAVFRGANPTDGATISYYIRRLTGDPVSISIANAAGQPVATLTGAATPGINRVSWDLKPTKDVLTEYGGEGQKFVRPGDYTVTLSYGAVKQTATLHVEAAPGIETR